MRIKNCLFLWFYFTQLGLFSQEEKGVYSVQNIDLKYISTVFIDKSTSIKIEDILKDKIFGFEKKSDLNFGISSSNFWLHLKVDNNTNSYNTQFLCFECTTLDSIIIYQIKNNSVLSTSILGENIPFYQRQKINKKYVLQIELNPSQSNEYYVKIPGLNQPVNLSGRLTNRNHFEILNESSFFFIGIIYGIMLLILLLNISFYIITRDFLYVNFSLQLIFSWISLIYFDGLIHQFVFPNSGYWSNQTIPIALCLTFFFSNKSVSEYYNLSELVPWANKTFKHLNYYILAILIFSFVHPLGFTFFIYSMSLITSIVAFLLLISILSVKKRGFEAYLFGLISTIFLIIFGSLFQAYILGIAPDLFITHNAMHFAVVTQAIFMALAVNDKFRILKNENSNYQEKLLLTLNEYSQNLTRDIEKERHRLAMDLHDSLGQDLLAFRNKILLIAKKNNLNSSLQQDLLMLSDNTAKTLDEVRNISYNLRPSIIDSFGLTTAIESLVDRIKNSNSLEISLLVKSSIDNLINKELEINVYRILQECFNNAIKHSEATSILLEIDKINNHIIIKFKDNGKGFHQSNMNKGSGIISLNDRVNILKGTINFESRINEGTLILIKIPFDNTKN
jgi:two-component system, sensor histidine kinase LadS